MPISYPLSIPNVAHIRRATFRMRAAVGVSESPFTFEQQVYAHQGGKWAGEVELIRMERANAEAWLGFLAGLNGREGTFLLGDPKGAAPRGSWVDTIRVNGGSQTGLTLGVDGAVPFATAKLGDYFQLGSGASTRLHKLTQDVTFDSAGGATLSFWPRLRSSPSDNDVLTLLAAKGHFRLASNENEWSEEELFYGISFGIEEAF